ncbi:MAG TPA: immunoglobulin domain-containing protein, partial [Bacillota bacterium]|nr:immunoglobulin domain-containing protein [Bacillota bacterium]
MCYSSQSTTPLAALPAISISGGFSWSVLWVGFRRGRLAATVWVVGWLLLQLAPQAKALDVLLIWDVNDSRTAALASALQQAGHTVTLSSTSEAGYDGANPSPAAFSVVIHLNGTTYLADMPEAGQQALTKFVARGGGYIGSEWNAFEWLQGRLQQMSELILLDSSSGREGSVTVTNASSVADPPLLAGLTPSFTFRAGQNVGLAHTFEQSPVTVLARDTAGNDAVVVRPYGRGRVVAFHHAANYGAFNTLLDANVQRLYANAVAWAGSSAPWITVQPQSRTGLAGAPAAFSVTVSGAEPLSYQWLKNAAPLTNGGNLSGATSAALNLAKVGGEDVASYSVLVSNAFGCVTSLVATLTVNYLPALTSQPGSVTTNAGCAVAFAVTTTGTPPLRYQWFHNRTNRLRDDQRISGATSSTLSRSDVSDPDQGCYQAVVENDYGAVTSAVATLTVIHPPRLLSQPANVMTSAG